MIYDCFSFFNELDLLEIRLNILKDVVDKFVLVEVGETHTGKPKPMLFAENRARFAEFADRIIYIPIEKFPPICTTDWARENYQRNAIAEGLKDAHDNDMILISDLDEIPRPESIRANIGRPGITVFDQTYYAFYLNYRNVRQRWWYGTRMLSYRDFCHCFDDVATWEDEFLPAQVNNGTTASKIRCRPLPRSHGGAHVVKNAGWHFTCLGGAKAVMTKMRAVVPHHDFNPDDEALTEKAVAALIEQGRGPALKMNCYAVRLNSTFPDYILKNTGRYEHLIFNLSPEYARRTRWARLSRTAQGCAIGFCERLMPNGLHLALHKLRMRLLKK